METIFLQLKDLYDCCIILRERAHICGVLPTENRDSALYRVILSLEQIENNLCERTLNEVILENLTVDTCPHCGTKELLCGHNNVGCSSNRRKYVS